MLFEAAAYNRSAFSVAHPRLTVPLVRGRLAGERGGSGLCGQTGDLLIVLAHSVFLPLRRSPMNAWDDESPLCVSIGGAPRSQRTAPTRDPQTCQAAHTELGDTCGRRVSGRLRGGRSFNCICVRTEPGQTRGLPALFIFAVRV